jgi:hypothetical protein
MISEPAYERAVNLAASLAWHFSFSTQAAQVSYVVAGQGRGVDVHEFLARLAVIEPDAGLLPQQGSRGDALREMGLGNGGEYNIVLTARPQGSLPTAWWSSSYFVFLGDEAGTRPARL